MQNALLRQQDVLRQVERKQRARFAASSPKRNREAATSDRVRFGRVDRLGRDGISSPAGVRLCSAAFAFAASAGGELYSSHLIQRR